MRKFILMLGVLGNLLMAECRLDIVKREAAKEPLWTIGLDLTIINSKECNPKNIEFFVLRGHTDFMVMKKYRDGVIWAGAKDKLIVRPQSYDGSGLKNTVYLEIRDVNKITSFYLVTKDHKRIFFDVSSIQPPEVKKIQEEEPEVPDPVYYPEPDTGTNYKDVEAQNEQLRLARERAAVAERQRQQISGPSVVIKPFDPTGLHIKGFKYAYVMDIRNIDFEPVYDNIRVCWKEKDDFFPDYGKRLTTYGLSYINGPCDAVPTTEIIIGNEKREYVFFNNDGAVPESVQLVKNGRFINLNITK